MGVGCPQEMSESPLPHKHCRSMQGDLGDVGHPNQSLLSGVGVSGDPREVGHPQQSLTSGAVDSVLSLGHGMCRWGPGEASPSAVPSGSARLSSSKLVQAKVLFRVQQFGGGGLLGNSTLVGLTHRGAEVVTGTPMAMGRKQRSQPPCSPQNSSINPTAPLLPLITLNSPHQPSSLSPPQCPRTAPAGSPAPPETLKLPQCPPPEPPSDDPQDPAAPSQPTTAPPLYFPLAVPP